MHAALPIPVPHHLIYRAIQMERAGRWKLASMPATKGSCGSKYTVESFAPPPKPNPKPPNKHLSRLRAQQPRWDNLAETSPCYLNLPRSRTLPPLPGAERKVRTLTPPEQRAQLAQHKKSSISLKRILTQASLKARQVRGKGVRSSLQQPTKSSLAKSSNRVLQQDAKQDVKQQESKGHKESYKQQPQPKLARQKKVAQKVSSVSSKLDNTEKRKRASGSTKKLKKI